MKYFILYSFYFGLLLTSCRKGNQSNSNQNQSLVGKWKWIRQTDAKAINGLPYDTLTPQNMGYTEFLNLNMNSTWSLVRNDKTLNSGVFKFLKVFTPAGPITFLDFVNNFGRDSIVNHSIFNDTLYISNTLYIDKYTINVYSRQN
jgi:hypothetical protein